MYPHPHLPTSLRRAQEGSSRSSRAAVNKQEAGGRGVQLAGASVRFPCPGGCPPSPRQVPAKLLLASPPFASTRQSPSLLASQQAARVHSNPNLGLPHPGRKSSPEARTHDGDRPPPKCQHQRPTSRATEGCCPQRCRGDPPVLRRGQVKRLIKVDPKFSYIRLQAVQDSV